MKRMGASMAKGDEMELSKLEARQLMSYHAKVIRAIKEQDQKTGKTSERFIAEHKDRIEELRKYA